MESNNPTNISGDAYAPLSILARITLWVCLAMCGLVALVSLAAVFFYPTFVHWLGNSYDAFLRLNPWMIRAMLFSGFLVYGIAALGCILMMKQRKRGFWLYAIPAFLLFAAALFFVFSPLNQIQLFILGASLLILSTQLKKMH
jgi:hypothetical protein